MSSDIAIALALFLGFVGLVIFSIGVVGRHATGEPRCVKCSEDVRPVAWDDAPRCPRCGADLARGGSVRLAGRRRRRPELVAGVVLLLSAIALWRADAWLAVRNLKWRDLRPLALELNALAPAGNDQWEAIASINRRLDGGQLSAASRRAILATSVPGLLSNSMQVRLASDASLEDLWPEVMSSFTTAAGLPTMQSRSGAPAPSPGLEVNWYLDYPAARTFGLPWFLLIDRIVIDGRDVEFRAGTSGDVRVRMPDETQPGMVTIECDCHFIVAPFGCIALMRQELTNVDGTLRATSSIGFPCAMRSFKVSAQLMIGPRGGDATIGGQR